MAAQALMDPADRINLLGDVAGLFLVAVVLGLLMPRRTAGLVHSQSRSNA